MLQQGVQRLLLPICPSLLLQARCLAVSAKDQMALIRQLREASGSPISEVKACLEASGWDVDKAYDALRKKGLAAAAKKASRHAAEGLVGVQVQGTSAAAIVEVNSETDFVARNDLFRKLVSQVATAALALQPANPVTHEVDLQQLLASRLSSGSSVADAAAEVAGQVRENIRVRRAFKMQTTTGSISTYIHQSAEPGLGRIVSAVLLQPKDGAASLQQQASPRVTQLGEQLAMHVAGMRPLYLSRQDVPAEVLDKERAILTEQASKTGKPAHLLAKVVEGRLSKYYEEVCLNEQGYVLEEGAKVQAIVNRVGKETGVPLSIAGFLRVQVGEGLERTEAKDFAAEVQQLAQQ